ncbi:MAG: hypothetical protein JWQ04_3329 [Pedosphaera sp.]|nr:hypothetical protein [Pedosphaera sp.]
MPRQIPESDWKRFSQLKPVLLNRFCQKILDEAGQIATGPTGTPHERYLKLYQFIQREDRKIADAFNDHRRSTALIMLTHLYSHGLMTKEELMTFGEETRQVILMVSASPE